MKSLAKAQALARDLADKLGKRYAGSSAIDTVRQDVDSAGWPMLFCSDGGVETTGAALIVIRISSVDAVSKDIFGNALVAFGPTILEVAQELTAANNPIPIDSDIWKAAFEAIKTGCRIQLKEITNGTAVSATSMDAATVAADLDDLYWPAHSV